MSTDIRGVGIVWVLALAAVAVAHPRRLYAASAAVIDQEVDGALAALDAQTPRPKELAEKVKWILVFPNIVKAGFLVGAEYGGALQ